MDWYFIFDVGFNKIKEEGLKYLLKSNWKNICEFEVSSDIIIQKNIISKIVSFLPN